MTEKGMIHIYTGEGKGKTTAALGLMIRFAGTGREAMLVQFLKKAESSELEVLEYTDNISYMPNPWNYGFVSDMTEDEKNEAAGIYAQYLDMIAFRVLQGGYGMLVLDEVIGAVAKGLVDEDQLIDLLDQLPDEMEVVLTGRGPSDRLLGRADYVTEMRKIKHPFDEGVRARKGIEY